MNLISFITGLQILLPHYHKQDDYVMAAEHDTIYLYNTDTPLTESEVKKMTDLGWYQDNTVDYDQSKDWIAYV